MHPEVKPLEDEGGIAIYDPIENARFVLYTDRNVLPRQADGGRIAFPVGTTVSIRTGSLVVPTRHSVHVRSPAGDHLDTFQGDDADSYLADGERLIELTSSAMKVYLVVPGPFEIVSHDEERALEIGLADVDEIVVGLRSFHEHPAAVIETPLEPEPVMGAVSASGSALKTLSCERSYPTLRGHPPALQQADELSIPDSLEPPDTDIRVRVPPSWEYVYPVAPLVFYLGATLRPGGTPRIEVGSWSFPLAGAGEDPETFTDRVHRALKQLFFLDCLTRTEGLYRIDLHERNELEGNLDLDFATLYDRSLEEQVRAYLDVPYGAVEDHLPTWHLCVDVQPVAEHVEALPYVLDDLPLIRSPLPREPATLGEEMDEAITGFARSTDDGGAGTGIQHRSADHEWSSMEKEVFSPRPASAMEHAYLGDGLPLRRNKAALTSFERRVEYDAPTKNNISVKIVCNDEDMADEAGVEDYYGVHDLVQYAIDVEYDLSRDRLASVLREEVDMLHYIGHIDESGFECADGKLDAHHLNDVGVDTFLLNACTSYEQGQALIDSGAKAGVASLSLVGNTAANRLGRTMARALNAGFTLRSALSLTEFTSSATQYLVLGDGGRKLVQAESGVPLLIEIVDGNVENEELTVGLVAHPDGYGQGSFTTPSIEQVTHQYLTFGRLDEFTLTFDEFQEFQSLQSHPVLVGNQLHWSNELDNENLIRFLEDGDFDSAGRTHSPVGR